MRDRIKKNEEEKPEKERIEKKKREEERQRKTEVVSAFQREKEEVGSHGIINGNWS